MSPALDHLRDGLFNGLADAGLVRLYGEAALDIQKKRYLLLLDEAEKRTLGNGCLLVSAPGRTELGGNHTDHNNGRVLAAAVDLDCIAAVAPTNGSQITLFSADYPETIRLDLTDLTPHSAERGTPQALIRGIATARAKAGRPVAGFTGVIHSTCRAGAGLSSSAAFSMLIGTAFNCLLEHILPEPVTLARDGQYAENNFFGKPCGLMDQLSSAVGETLAIDFINPDQPQISRITTSFEKSGYRLLVIDTGAGHIELTPDYAAIPEEISRCTHLLGQARARGLSLADVAPRLGELRQQTGDRALLRLLHFIAEDRRAAEQARALEAADFATFLELVKQSGRSSCGLLQNCSSPANSREQGILLAIALTELYFPKGVCRVHGGGFAGTVQAYIDGASFARYRSFMEQVFGLGSVLPIRIGRPGVCSFDGRDWQFSQTAAQKS